MFTKLTKQQRVQLFNALTTAFPSWNALELMVRLQLGENLHAISSPLSNIDNVVLDLITWAEAGGYLGELTDGALAQKPNNPQLKAFAATMTAAAPAVPPAVTPTAPPVPDDATKEQYQRMIWKAVAFASTAEFREEMIKREGSVCRVEFPENSGRGTGFLLGPDLVMTNYHVLEPFIKGQQQSQAVRCRFDYQENAEGTKVSDGRVAKLADANWLVRSSVDSDFDYALVRLAEKVGEDTMSTGGPTRGWLSPVPHAFSVGESVFIIQHPKAAPLKIASGGVALVQDRRVHYLANTLDGSSGSPCFTSDWKLAALHRGSNGIANIGVPFAGILTDLQNAPAVSLA